jgi:hypothetical protein
MPPATALGSWPVLINGCWHISYDIFSHLWTDCIGSWGVKGFTQVHILPMTALGLRWMIKREILRSLLFSVLEAWNDNSQRNLRIEFNPLISQIWKPKVRGQVTRSCSWPDVDLWSPCLQAWSASHFIISPEVALTQFLISSFCQPGHPAAHFCGDSCVCPNKSLGPGLYSSPLGNSLNPSPCITLQEVLGVVLDWP